MNRPPVMRPLVVLAVVAFLPSLALAEVSVQLNARGEFKKMLYLTEERGRARTVWGQVRPHQSPNVMLNPLGDNLGDEAPVIQISPVTRLPWVVWAKNYGNLKQLVWSTWDSNARRWADPRPITPGTPLIWDDRTPALAFDGFGTPYLVWSRAEQTAAIYFSTLVSGIWTPALRISDERVDSRAPGITLEGTMAVITYRTPAGPVTKKIAAAFLLDSAASLMDNPIPPLGGPSPTDGPSGDLPGRDGFIKRR